MKKILYNEQKITISDINNNINRVKILLLNSKNEVLLGYSHKGYQFPGGHIEEKETFDEGIIREVREETGIELQVEDYKPFFIIEYYTKDYPEEGLNTSYLINHYVIKTDAKVNLENTNYTENELAGKFKLVYVSIDEVIDLAKEELTQANTNINKNIYNDMIKVIEAYEEFIQS